MNKLQNYLDMAAEKLDKQGHADLADRVDAYSIVVATAPARERKCIAQALACIEREANLRGASKRPASKRSAGKADIKNRVASLRRRRAMRARREDVNSRRSINASKTLDRKKLASRKSATSRPASSNLRSARKARLQRR